MSSYERNYMALVDRVILNGDIRPSRAGKTRSLFSQSIQIPGLSSGVFPLLTTRQLYPMSVLGELAAFLKGAEYLSTFKEYGCNYWDDNAMAWLENMGRDPEDMRVGKIYGSKWLDYHGINQLELLVRTLKSDPWSRRHILLTWDPSETDQCLPPCHIIAQFYVTIGPTVSCNVYMRSVDLCLGLPSDVILYAALLCLVAQEVNYAPGMLSFQFGDTHIYENHIDSWDRQAANMIKGDTLYELCSSASLGNFAPVDFAFKNYEGYPRIHYELNV
jgi:thymidylate synthase